MAMTGRIVASMVLAGTAVLAFQVQPVGDPPVDPVEPIQKLMEQVSDGTIKEDAEKKAGQFALVSAGDTCFMRHRRVRPGVDRGLRRQLAAVRLVEGQPESAEIRSALYGKLSGLALWKTHMQEADVALRLGDLDRALLAITKARDIADVPDVCLSDAALFSARVFIQQGARDQAHALLVDATRLDPVHFNAQFEHALNSMAMIGLGAADCVASVEAMVQSTIRMKAMIETSSQLFRLSERMLQHETAQRNRSFLLGFIEEQAGQPDNAAVLYAAGLQAFLEAPEAVCRSEMIAALEISLKRVTQ